MSDAANYRQATIQKIDNLYTLYAGPMGQIICDDALDEWQNVQGNSSYIKLDGYVKLLIEELPDSDLQKLFTNDLLADETVNQIVSITRYLKTI